MTKETLNKKLIQLSNASNKFLKLTDEIYAYSIKKYGHTPSEIDCDEILDIFELSRQSKPMTADEFDKYMIESVEMFENK